MDGGLAANLRRECRGQRLLAKPKILHSLRFRSLQRRNLVELLECAHALLEALGRARQHQEREAVRRSVVHAREGYFNVSLISVCAVCRHRDLQLTVDNAWSTNDEKDARTPSQVTVRAGSLYDDRW